MSSREAKQASPHTDLTNKDVPAADAPDASPALQGRRDFLTKSGALLAVLGMCGLAGAEPVNAQCSVLTKEQFGDINVIMDEAMRIYDIHPPLQRYGSSLPPDVRATLSQITSDDLRTASALHTRLNDLACHASTDVNIGIIGM
jgi:hypothetical protein